MNFNDYTDEVAETFVALVLAFLETLQSLGVPTTGQQMAVMREEAKYARGQSNLVGLILGVTVATIVGVGVAIPIINDVEANTNLSGTTALIVGFLGTFVALLLLVAIASPLMNRM